MEDNLEAKAAEDPVRVAILSIIGSVAPDADVSNLKDDIRLRDQLDLDSMDFLDIVMELRKKYQIEVPKEDYNKLATINSAVLYLSKYRGRFSS